MKNHETDVVFGLTPKLPLNYVERQGVDQAFKRALRQNRHVVIHGGSKQGKTSLRKRHLKEDAAVTVVCQNKWALSDLFVSILKQTGFRIELSAKKATENRNKVSASFGAGFNLPFLGKVDGKAGGEREATGTKEIETKPFELDPADANDVIEALRSVKFDGYIVLEDFHYLPEETQKDFAFALKAFFEISEIRFVIIGVWKEADRLASYNGDLRMRLANVDADAWSKSELLQVIQKGEELLNLSFSQRLKDELLGSCFESVAIVQEACARVCHSVAVERTCIEHKNIRSGMSGPDLVKAIVMDGAGQFHDFVVNIAAGFQATQLQIYYWIMRFILESNDDALKRGLSLNEMVTFIRDEHPYEVQTASITQSLKALRSLQAQKNVRPIIIDYDAVNRRLEIMDRSFLIWRGVLTDDETQQLVDLAEPAN